MRKLAWTVAIVTAPALLILAYRVSPPWGLIIGGVLLIATDQTLRVILKQK